MEVYEVEAKNRICRVDSGEFLRKRRTARFEDRFHVRLVLFGAGLSDIKRRKEWTRAFFIHAAPKD